MVNNKNYLPALALFLLIGCDSGGNDGPTILPAPDSLILSAKKYEQDKLKADSIAIKVFIDKAGQITANGKLVSLAALDSTFSQLKINKGAVYYSRENVQEDPPAESMKVMELITKHGLPVQFYTDKTFTQIVSFK